MPRVLDSRKSAEAIQRGGEIFSREECAGCHAPPEYTKPGRYDVGLADEAGPREFNPPSLRGAARRGALLHDGRAATLEDAFRDIRHPGGAELASDEIQALVAFLKSL